MHISVRMWSTECKKQRSRSYQKLTALYITLKQFKWLHIFYTAVTFPDILLFTSPTLCVLNSDCLLQLWLIIKSSPWLLYLKMHEKKKRVSFNAWRTPYPMLMDAWIANLLLHSILIDHFSDLSRYTHYLKMTWITVIQYNWGKNDKEACTQ